MSVDWTGDESDIVTEQIAARVARARLDVAEWTPRQIAPRHLPRAGGAAQAGGGAGTPECVDLPRGGTG